MKEFYKFQKTIKIIILKLTKIMPLQSQSCLTETRKYAKYYFWNINIGSIEIIAI